MKSSSNKGMETIALDVGSVRVGIAGVAAGSSVALPLDTWERQGGTAEQKIVKLIQDSNIGHIIVGLPLNDNGTESRQSEKVRRFCRRLKRRVPVEITFIDEYASSYEAEERLQELKVNSKKAKRLGSVDAVAAAVILQRFLDTRKIRDE